MANTHYGNIGDVWKHLVLAEVLAMEQPAAYWESHAGAARYVLAPSPGRTYGVGHFFQHAPGSPALSRCAYVRILTQLARGGQLTTYPGSPHIAMTLLEPRRAAFTFCDLDEDSLGDIRAAAAELGHPADRVETAACDGVAALHERLRGLAPDDAPATFLHVDPYKPLEPNPQGITPVDLFSQAAGQGARAMHWYGFHARRERRELLARLDRAAAGPRVWCGEVTLRAIDGLLDFDSGVLGCGVVLANLSSDTTRACRRLGLGLESVYRSAVLPGGVDGSLTFAMRWLCG